MGQGPDFEGDGLSAAVVHGIQVDLASFGTLRDTMSSEADYTLDPHVTNALQRYSGDPTLAPASPSANMGAFRDLYGQSLQDTLDRLLAFVSESSLLVDVATRILNEYTSVDQLAGASVQDITMMLSMTGNSANPQG